MVAELLPLAEVVPIQDTFATGVVPMLADGMCVRLLFWAEHPVIGTGKAERVLVAKIIFPVECYRVALRELIRPRVIEA
jgi:hypothetical protein